MATMFARETRRPVQAVIEEWEAELTPPSDLYQSILALRGALERTERNFRAVEEGELESSWRLISEVHNREAQLETERKRVTMMITLTAESIAKAERLEEENLGLRQRVDELEEETKGLDEELSLWKHSSLRR